MPRKAALVPTEHLHLKLEASDRARVDLLLYSPLEGRVPKGSHKAFFEARIREFFDRESLELPGGHQVYGSAAAITSLRDVLTTLKESHQ